MYADTTRPRGGDAPGAGETTVLNEDAIPRAASGRTLEGSGIALRPYQHRAVQGLREHFRAGRRRLLLVAPTGAGKTVIAAHVMTSAHTRGRRVLFVAHRRELIAQTWKKLLDAGVPPRAIGILMATDPRANAGAPIQVASIDTLRNREWPAADLVIVDEAHRSLARSYVDVIEHYAERNAAVLGLTATPYRADGGGLGDVYETLEVVATPADLIAQGFIVEPRVFAAAGPNLQGVRTRRGDYVESELADAVNNGALVGNIVDHWRRHADGVRTVAFAVNVAHSQHIAERFREAGIAAEHLDGATPNDERDAILARLESGETRVVSNCGVLCEGWDQPSVKCAILARPTKSTGLYLQQAGRILRPWHDVRAIVLDHAGNALEHGLPQDDRDFSLDPSAKQRSGSAPAKECPTCGTVIPLGVTVCPECSYEFPPQEAPEEEQDGELTEIKPVSVDELRAAFDELLDEWKRTNERRAQRGEKPMKPGWIYFRFRETFGRKPPPGCNLPAEIATAEEKAEALRELHAKAQAKGYKPGWAVHRFVARFGHRPDEEEVAA